MKIINSGDKSISANDTEALTDIYKTHTKGHGW